MNDHQHIFNRVIDSVAVSALGATLLGVLPAATTILVFIVAVIRFFETATVRAALKRLRKWFLG